ncbi:MAG: hypothetical protein KDB16_16145 [Acidimicrobiales bacterium]|nr:hypothetical protein [Acidimicrobiales bacterium]
MWSPVEAARRAQQAIEERNDAVESLHELGMTRVEAERVLRRQRAEAYTRLKLGKADSEWSPSNAEERKAWLDAQCSEAQAAADLADVLYWTERERVQHLAATVEYCRTVIATHRQARVD